MRALLVVFVSALLACDPSAARTDELSSPDAAIVATDDAALDSTNDAPTIDGAPETAPPPPPARGANVPWDEYEAEDATHDGTLLGPSRTFGELASEASGRRAVRLDAGQSLRLSAKRKANSIVVRYSIPDGSESSIAVRIDGKKALDLAVTSRYAWIYGGESGSSSNDPKTGGAHHFYDEARALLPAFPAGAEIELKNEDGVATTIDLVDLEDVAPPLERPAGALSITEYGAVADDGKDDGPAIAKCIAAAREQKKSVFIPVGTFHSTTTAIDVANVTIAGAGMWHSTIAGFFARFRCTGDECRYHDFSVFGETVTRDDASPESAFLGGGGTGSRLQNVWIEHQKTGWWVGPTETDGLQIRGCRFRDLFADGVNLCNGASNAIVEDSHARNTGDDAFASWSPSSEGGVNTNNVFRHLSVQLPWRANCFAIYGGKDNRIEDSTCADTMEYPGVLLAQQFSSHPFEGTTTVARVTLLRAGGPMYGQHHGALKLHAFDADMGGFHLEDVEIVDPTFAGLHLQGAHTLSAVVLDNLTIEGGILVNADAKGHATANGVVVTKGALTNESSAFTFDRGPGNAGW
ncbi:MAG: glycosyl hydrolase family 28-related protein [Polyangiales bacterium]